MKRFLFAFIAVLAALATARAVAAGEEGKAPDESQKKAVFLRLVSTFESNRRNHGSEALKIKRACLEEIGDLKFGPAVQFLEGVLASEKEGALIVSAMTALGKLDSVQAVQAAFKAGMNTKADDLVRDAIPWGLRHSHDEKAAEWIAKTIMKASDPRLKLAAVESLGVMGCKCATEALIKKSKDKDVVIAYEAVRSLGMIADEKSLPTLHEAAVSRDWRIREAAAFGLGSFKDDATFLILCRLVLDEEWHVREAAVLSLRKIGRKEASEALIESLRESCRRVAVEIRDTLTGWTGKDLGFDADLWKAWWLSKGREEQDGSVKPELTVTYHGMKISSDRVLFIIDVSGSMEWGGRMGKAKAELLDVLRKIDTKTEFNIMTFSGSPLFFRKEMVPMSPDSLSAAEEWLAKQSPFGGTNSYDTIKESMEEIAGVDTIFFLSDGIPTVGKYIEQEKILAEVAKMNRFRRIRIHAVALLTGEGPAEANEDKEAAERFMKQLAGENDGEFVCKK